MPAAIDLERVYDDHAQALFGFLLNLTRNEEDTRDLLQELFVKLSRQPNLTWYGWRVSKLFCSRFGRDWRSTVGPTRSSTNYSE